VPADCADENATPTVVADEGTAYACCTNAMADVVPGTVNASGLLATPPTVTTTLPVVAPAGTGTTMLVADQLVGVAVTPLKVTVLVPFVDPKFKPAIVTAVPTAPLAGDRLVRLGALALVIVNAIALLAMPPTVTTTFPVAAPAGTGTLMLDDDQLDGAAAAPLNVTVLVPCVDPKFAPAIVTMVPATPLEGDRLTIEGADTVAEAVPDASAEYELTAPFVLYARTAK